MGGKLGLDNQVELKEILGKVKNGLIEHTNSKRQTNVKGGISKE